MEYKYHRVIGISALTLLMIMMMFSADYIYMKAWAFSITEFVGVNDTGSAIRVGNQTWVASTTADDNIQIYVGGVVVATASVTDPLRMGVYNNRVYVYTFSSTVVEFEPNTVTYFPNQLRTSSGLACGTTVLSGFFAMNNGTFWCTTPTTDIIKKLDLSSFTILSSTTTNTGANACNDPLDPVYDSASDTVFLACDTTNNIVAVQAPMTDGTPDYGVSRTVTTNTKMAFDRVTNKLFAGGGGVTPNLYNVTLGSGIASFISYTTLGTSGADVILDLNGHFIWGDDSNDVVRIIDSGTGDILLSASLTTVNSASTTFFAYSSILVYIGNVGASSQNWAVMDLTGIPSGGGGGGGGGIPTASVCYIDTNADGIANLVYHDTTGPAGVPDGMCDGSVLDFPENDPADCTANGLARLIASLLGIDCDDDPNPATNGIGMLYMLFLGLFVMGVIFAGSRKFNFDMASIHPAVWLFFAVGITGFSWQVGWVDSIVFYAMIVISAGVGAFGLYQKLRSNGG